jgi:hypothetical protein
MNDFTVNLPYRGIWPNGTKNPIRKNWISYDLFLAIIQVAKKLKIEDINSYIIIAFSY